MNLTVRYGISPDGEVLDILHTASETKGVLLYTRSGPRTAEQNPVERSAAITHGSSSAGEGGLEDLLGRSEGEDL